MELKLSDYRDTCVGLHGIQEAFKLCHIPLLVYKDVYGALALEGSSGTGKTTLVQRLGELIRRAGGGDWAVFSADKARYEDFVGCPIPNSETKEMDMYPMKQAVATKETVMIDEINRADYSNQEKWMSLLASRKIDGFDVACKYLYAGMNPVMSDKNDIYEGVQPLDKALGERIIGLIRMKNFHELSRAEQLHVMKAGLDQSAWEPSQKDIDLHIAFVQAARDLYEENKEKHIDRVCEYIHLVQKELKTETEGATTVEARRAQFIMFNVLAVYSLNTLYFGKSSFAASALEGLELSFPGRLWEQPIPLTAIQQAHKIAKEVLTISEEERLQGTGNFEGLESPLGEIIKAAKAQKDKEFISKAIHSHLPKVEVDPINHYVYAIAAVTGLTKDFKETQTTMKAQEFDRLKRIVENLKKSDAYQGAKAAGLHYRRQKAMPEGYKYPEYISNDMSDSSLNGFHGSIHFNVGWYTQAIAETVNVQFKNGIGYMNVAERLAEAQAVFREIAVKVENPDFEMTLTYGN